MRAFGFESSLPSRVRSRLLDGSGSGTKSPSQLHPLGGLRSLELLKAGEWVRPLLGYLASVQLGPWLRAGAAKLSSNQNGLQEGPFAPRPKAPAPIAPHGRGAPRVNLRCSHWQGGALIHPPANYGRNHEGESRLTIRSLSWYHPTDRGPLEIMRAACLLYGGAGDQFIRIPNE